MSITIVYIHGFLGKEVSPLGEELRKLCRENRVGYAGVKWQSGTTDSLVVNSVKQVLVNESTSPSDSIFEFVGNAVFGACKNTLNQWNCANQKVTATAKTVREIIRYVLKEYYAKDAKFEKMSSQKLESEKLSGSQKSEIANKPGTKSNKVYPRCIAIVGFSLGAKVVMEFLKTVRDPVVLQAIHSITLCGAAVDRNESPDLDRLLQYQPGFHVKNLYSSDDEILGFLYPIATGYMAAGRFGFDCPNVDNIGMQVGHTEYNVIAEDILKIALQLH